ncbi:protein Mis18-beta [Myripristis murdjan]|uniref:Protein Mis18-beta-like n=1 Tax=Myripristis murdjan TaxID=586833 RepID=A0A667YVH7_9TELE|nr:protein Mis18-beta-like [Myripristis murdjan]
MEFDASVLMHRTDDIKLAMEAERRSLMTLHCEQCNTVLGDSLGVCGELKSLDSILCLKVTHDVIISQDMESVLKGEMAHCICSSLKCSGCRRVLGTVIHSAPQHLAMLRSIFLLHKANISCYILNSSTMVKASTLSFDMKPIGESINEVRRQFQAQFNQMSRIKKRLAERSAASEMH